MTGRIVDDGWVFADRFVGTRWIWSTVQKRMWMSANDGADVWSTFGRDNLVDVVAAVRQYYDYIHAEAFQSRCLFLHRLDLVQDAEIANARDFLQQQQKSRISSKAFWFQSRTAYAITRIDHTEHANSPFISIDDDGLLVFALDLRLPGIIDVANHRWKLDMLQKWHQTINAIVEFMIAYRLQFQNRMSMSYSSASLFLCSALPTITSALHIFKKCWVTFHRPKV